MKTLRYVVSPLLLTLICGGACYGEEAKSAALRGSGTSAPDTQPDWLDRIDRIHEPGYMDWITVAWATMLLKQEIIPAEDAPKAVPVVLQLWDFDFMEDERAWGQFYKNKYFFLRRLDTELAGMMMVARTQPPARQMLEVRHLLMKEMCQIYDMQEATLDLAEQHIDTIMPGYTHFRHAQPTTFGHYLLSVSDAVARATATLEDGYHLMSLNEMGCGALAGTSWPIDRDLVSRYLGMEGLIENTNDAVGYTDGYLVVVCGLTNVTNIASRIALELSFWSGSEYGFLDIGARRGTSFMMPQKDGNPNSMELVRMYAGQMMGHLTGVAAAGLRAPHGDVFEMLHLAEPTIAALETTEKCTAELTGEMRKMEVHKERMLAVIRESYICATELANQMVRDDGLGYLTAHEVVNQFVLASREKKIPATEARAAMLDEAAREVLGRELGMTDARLRELLDPAYFIKVTNSRGGVSAGEVTRMIADRRQKLAESRARHLKRIDALEQAQHDMLSDLRGLAEKSENASR